MAGASQKIEGHFGIGTSTPSNNLQIVGGVTAGGFTSSAGWTAIPNYSTFTSGLVCRRVGSFLQLRGNIAFSGGAWGLVLGYLPAACSIATDLAYAPAACWSGTTNYACLFSISASNGQFNYYGPAGPTNFGPAGTFPAD